MINAVNNPQTTQRATAASNLQSAQALATQPTPHRLAGQEDALALSSAALRYDAEPIDEKVAQIKKLIANDLYMSEDKVDVVVEKLHKALHGDARQCLMGTRKLA